MQKLVLRSQSNLHKIQYGLFGVLLIAVLLATNSPIKAHAQGSMPSLNKLKGIIYSPRICPYKPYIIAYERQNRDVQELYFYNQALSQIFRIATEGPENRPESLEDVLLQLYEEADFDITRISKYEGQLEWRPVVDSKFRQWFVFVSSISGQYDLYLSYLDKSGKSAKPPIRLDHPGVDQFPRWSPDGNHLVFVSSESGGADLYLAKDISKVLRSGNSSSFAPIKLTKTGQEVYPVWSPDGKYIAFQSNTWDGGKINEGISLLDMSKMDDRKLRLIRLTTELADYQEYKPSWSPDGQYIAYYVSQAGVGQASTNRLQDIGVLALLRDPETGRINRGRVMSGTSLRIADNVIPNRNSGPEWVQFSSSEKANPSLYVIYAKRDEDNFNPIILTNLAKWLERKIDFDTEVSGAFGTKLHREVYTYNNSVRQLAFVSQVGDVNQLQVKTLNIGKFSVLQPQLMPVELEKSSAVMRSVVPGWAQWYKGQKTKAIVLGGAFVVSSILATVFYSSFTSAESDYEDAQQIYGNAISDFDPKFEEWLESYNDAKSAAQKSNVFTGIIAGIWVLNVLDSQLGFPATKLVPIYTANITLPEVRMTYLNGKPAYWLGARISF